MRSSETRPEIELARSRPERGPKKRRISNSPHEDAGTTQPLCQFNCGHNEFSFDSAKIEIGKAASEPGDVGFFVSDSWHRRLPPQEKSHGRYFLQVIYGRREIAQRVLPGEVLNPANEAALARATTPRQRELLGIHEQGFYDA